ncbi:AhpC/TSA family protein [Paracoccus pantotrophus]|uniref:AhpC/TSA family protein n=1 Tax=Paracoccus pantotrophus TaxID=82367 RepID=A0AAE6NRW2_PARPN|nr:thioredoxin family protein [Paracoccus pantotrophus]QFG35471.1 thioredoxin family protein [Paracoccus pantotrophus]RKS44305.1 AhpC/TSA family protein [Paracoccus pantotrophus]
MAVRPPVCDFGAKAPDFTLPDPDGRMVSFRDIAGTRGTLVMFICNHCPYVQAVIDRIRRDAAELQQLGIGVVAISANDVGEYPQDGPEQMKIEAEKHGFTFPYLYDESQDVARAYGAECTPDFFGYNAAGELQYRGRLDASGRNPAPPDARRELYEAMVQIAETGQGPRDQVASMGCSIKWKA